MLHKNKVQHFWFCKENKQILGKLLILPGLPSREESPEEGAPDPVGRLVRSLPTRVEDDREGLLKCLTTRELDAPEWGSISGLEDSDLLKLRKSKGHQPTPPNQPGRKRLYKKLEMPGFTSCTGIQELGLVLNGRL